MRERLLYSITLHSWNASGKGSLSSISSQKTTNHSSTLLPEGLAEETLQTLALLFPMTNPETRKWFENIATTQNIDKKAIRCGRLRIEDRRIKAFKFWHDRLVVLKQLFDEAEPSTISQWWCDRRRRVQWYTFWVAALVLALTVFFGVVQSVEGALQVYKAYHPL